MAIKLCGEAGGVGGEGAESAQRRVGYQVIFVSMNVSRGNRIFVNSLRLIH